MFCPDCGYAAHLDALSTNGVPTRTARAVAVVGLSGSEHHLDVVELTRVSAEIRRDEAGIGDRNDERKREHFSIAVAADIDPAHVARKWYVNGYDFGTKYLRRMDIRWVNLGRQVAHGPSRLIAGIDEPAALFRVCEGCGKLDRSSRTNRADEHRAWCRYRKAPDEHVRSIALMRTLTTQGAVIRLPLSVTLGDRFAIPSLAAALLLGLHEQIGGSPDHIEIASINEPVPGESWLHQRGPAAARHRTGWHGLPGRAGRPRAGVGPASPGLGASPPLCLPGRATAGLSPLPSSVRGTVAGRQRLPRRRRTAPARHPHGRSSPTPSRPAR